MRIPHIRLRVRHLMLVVVVVALGFWINDQATVNTRAAKYRRKVAYCERMVRKCKAIVATDPVRQAKEADYWLDDPFWCNPEWTAKMVGYFEALRLKYAWAAEHPRDPVAPDPPQP